MTENKRFTYMEQFNGFCDVYDNGKILSCMRLEYVENTVNRLNELYDEIEQLKSVNMEYEDVFGRLEEENEQLKKTNNLLSDFRGYIDIKQQGIKDEKQQKRFLKIHDDYYIQYGDDKELFDLHKPADIRSLCIILNREHGFTELQCEYNDKEYEE